MSRPELCPDHIQVGAGLGVRAVTREGSRGRLLGLSERPFYCLSPLGGLMQTNRCPTPSPAPENMLRPSVRFIDFFAPAKTLPAASGRLCRRGRAVHVPGRSYTSLFLRSGRRFRGTGMFRPCHGPLFIGSFCTVSRFSLPYTTPVVSGGKRKRDAVLSCFRRIVFRFGGSHYHSGNGAALIGFCEGGRAGNPMPQLSPCINILRSDRYDGIARGYIQFKDRPSDRLHAYF